MKRIVIIGAGFAGLAAAKALRHADADILVIDRANHNLFQPLLYQVATTVLSPAQIASPIRGLLKNQRNTTVFLCEVSGINKDAKLIRPITPRDQFYMVGRCIFNLRVTRFPGASSFQKRICPGTPLARYLRRLCASVSGCTSNAP